MAAFRGRVPTFWVFRWNNFCLAVPNLLDHTEFRSVGGGKLKHALDNVLGRGRGPFGLLVETLRGEHHVSGFEGYVAVGRFEVPPDRLKGWSCQGREFKLVEVSDLGEELLSGGRAYDVRYSRIGYSELSRNVRITSSVDVKEEDLSMKGREPNRTG